jgi:acylphosphatase
VEAHVQGQAGACDRLVAACREGPSGARVEVIEVTRARADPTLRAFDLLASA